MNKLIFLSIFFVTFDLCACVFRNLSSPNIPSEILGLTPVNCFRAESFLSSQQEQSSPSQLMPLIDKNSFCECIGTEAEKFSFAPEQTDLDRFQLASASKIREKIDNSISVLAVRMAVMNGEMFEANKDEGELCRSLLEEELQDLKCPGSDTILSATQIKREVSKYYDEAGKRAGKLIDDKTQSCGEEDIGMSFSQIIDIRSSVAPAIALNIQKIIQSAPESLRNSKTSFKDLVEDPMFLISLSSNPELLQNFLSFRDTLQQHPVLRELVSNQDLYNQMNSDQTLDPQILIGSINSQFRDKTELHCRNLKSQIVNLYCTQKDTIYSPPDFSEFQDIVGSMIPADSGVTLSNINYFRHKSISEFFCSSDGSQYRDIENDIYQFFPTQATDQAHDDYSMTRNVTSSLNDDKSLLCPYLPPPTEKWANLEQKYNDCSPDQTNQAEPSTSPMSYECMMVYELYRRLKPGRDILADRIRTEVESTLELGSEESEINLIVEERLARLKAGDFLDAQEQPYRIYDYFSGRAERIESLAVTTETPTPETATEAGAPPTGPGSTSTGGSGGVVSSGTGSAGVAGGRLAGANLGSNTSGTNGAFNGRSPASGESAADAERRRRTQELFDNVRDRLERSEASITETDPERRRQRRLENLAPGFTIPDRVATPSSAVLASNSAEVSNGVINGRVTEPQFQEGSQAGETANDSYNRALLDGYNAQVAARTPTSTQPSPISVAGFGESALATEIPELSVSGDFQEDLDTTLETRIEDARSLLELFNAFTRSIMITHKEHPDYRVQVMREGETFRVISHGNDVNPDYREFLSSIQRFFADPENFLKYKSNLEALVTGVEIQSEPTEGPAFSDFERLN